MNHAARLETVDWNAFVQQYWQKQPVVIHAHPLASPEEIFSILVGACDLYRAQAPNAPYLKLYVNGRQVTEDVRSYLPTAADGSAAAYDARLRRELDAASFVLFMTGFEGYQGALFDRAKAFLNGLFSRVGIPAGHGELELFLGRYTYTPGGIHNEACTNFQWVIDGVKTMHTWPEEQWRTGDLAVHVQHDPTSREEENFLDTLDVEDFRAQSTPLTGTAGDILYWPSRFWHVGETPELSMAITVALYMDGRPFDLVNHVLQGVLEQRLGPYRQVSSYSLPWIERGAAEEQPLEPSLAASVEALRGALDDPAFRQELATAWLRRMTSLGFSKVPEWQPAEPLAPGERIRVDPHDPIVWTTAGSQMIIAANGYTYTTENRSEVAELIRRLNTGEAATVAELLSAAATDPRAGAESLRPVLDALSGMRAFARVT